MPPQRKSQKTRERLLQASGELFADKGFRGATIAEICEKAGTNIASVNYHFQDKENLYIQAWRYSFRSNMPVDPDPDLPAVERLEFRVKALLDQVRGKDMSHFAIIMKERANPTGLLDESLKEMFATMRTRMIDIIREILPAGTAGKTVELCALSVMGQCLHFTHKAMVECQINKKKLPTAAESKQAAEHIVRFSLAGMDSYRKGKKQ